MSNDVPQLPVGCGYTGHDFGAAYPDSQCFGGRLYDLDNCDEHGNLYEPGDYLYCPDCCHEEWLESQRDEIENVGYCAASEGVPQEKCPFPAAARVYPKDGEWLKAAWIKGWNQYQLEAAQAAKRKEGQ